MAIKLLTYDVYRTGMSLFKDLADQTYQDKVTLPGYTFRKLAPSQVPAGYSEAYCLIKVVQGDETVSGDIIGMVGESAAGVIFSYVVGSTPLASDWLSQEAGGPPLTPNPDMLYLICSNDLYKNSIYSYNNTTHLYEEVLSGMGEGVTFSYIVGSTPFASGWLSETAGGTALTPLNDQLYLVITPGKYENTLYRWNATASSYVMIAGGGSSAVFSYIVGSTPFAAGWLSDEDGGSPITPDPSQIYLVVTPGKYENTMYRWNTTVSSYVLIAGGGSGSGAVFSYIVGDTPFTNTWLSDEVGGDPLVPAEGQLYLVLTPGKYQNIMYRWDDTLHSYLQVLGGSSGAQFSYIVGDTPFAAGWLSDEVSGSAITPETGRLYLVLTQGEYYNVFYRWDGTRYVEVIRCGTDSIAPLFDPANAYESGTFLSYNNHVYCLTEAHTADDPWDPTKATQVRVFDYMPLLMDTSDVNEIKTSFNMILPYSGDDVLSYHERPVGLWIDGETILYERTISGSTISGTTGTILTHLPNDITYCWLFRLLVSNGTYVKNMLESASIKEDGSDIFMVADSDSLFRSKTFYATVRYIKQQPGVFSPNDKLVGLWYDGVTPVYERHITGTTINDTSGALNTGITQTASYAWLEDFAVSNGEYVRNLMDSVAIKQDASEIYMVADADSLFRNKTYYATVRYTVPIPNANA